MQENDGVLLNPVETCDNNARHDDNEKQVQAIIADEVTHFKKHNLSVAKLAAICSKENGQLLEGVSPDIGVVFLMKKYSMIYIMHRA